MYLVAGAVADSRAGIVEESIRHGSGDGVPPRPAARGPSDPRATCRLPRRIEPARRLRCPRRHGPVRGRRPARVERGVGGVAVGLRRRAGRLRRRGGARLRAPRGSRSPAPDARHRDRGARPRRLRLDLPAARDGGSGSAPLFSGSPSATSTSTTRAGSATWPSSRCRSSPQRACRVWWSALSRRVRRSPGSAPRRSHSSPGRSWREGVSSGSRWSPRYLGAAAPLLYGMRHPPVAMGLGVRGRRCPHRRTARERRLRAVLRRRHDLHGVGDRRPSEPLATGPSLSDVGRKGLSRRDPIVEHIRAEPGRYLTWAPPAAYFEKGYLWMKSPADWPALRADERVIVRVPDAWATTPCSYPATGDISAPPTNSRSSTTRRCSTCRLRRMCAFSGLRYLVVPTGLEPPVRGEHRRARRRLLALGARRRPTAGDLQRRRGEIRR